MSKLQVVTGDHYLAFVLTEACRQSIISRYRQRFEVIKAHHVTIAYEFTERNIPKLQAVVDNTKQVVLGTLLGGDGIDVFNIYIDRTDIRPLSGFYHLTFARREDISSNDANKVLTGSIGQHVLAYSKYEILEGEFKLIPYDK